VKRLHTRTFDLSQKEPCDEYEKEERKEEWRECTEPIAESGLVLYIDAHIPQFFRRDPKIDERFGHRSVGLLFRFAMYARFICVRNFEFAATHHDLLHLSILHLLDDLGYGKFLGRLSRVTHHR